MNRPDVKENEMSRHVPYSVPEGYFGSLKTRLSAIPEQASRPAFMTRFTPYLALAAVFAVALILGNVFVQRTAPAGGSASEDEIIEYLIDSGISLAQLEETVNY